MEWVHVRCCVELLLISTVYSAFAGCNSFSAKLAEFQHFDDLKKLGTLLALSLIFTGGCDLLHARRLIRSLGVCAVPLNARLAGRIGARFPLAERFSHGLPGFVIRQHPAPAARPLAR